MPIKDLLKRNLNTPISEVIQVDQEEESAVRSEIIEYVVTDRIREHYRELFRAMSEAPAEQRDSVGVWVSGFFGSGKSSFAKNLGYVLANGQLLGESASDLFKERVGDKQITDYIDYINTRIPTEVVMFDVQKDRAQTGSGNSSLSPYIYKVLLRHLGYAEDFDLAELEISLEREGRLAEFVQRFNDRYAAGEPRREWVRQGRISVERWNRTGAILHEMDPQTYPTVESFARGLAQNHVEVTPRLLVERTFELAARRVPGKTIAYIIDEVGQYVAYDQSRLEDLRAIVELFGRESKNRLKSHSIVGPVWFVVTAQERLDEVTSAMGDDKKVLFSKVRDRFGFEIDLSPADIKEVATRRVLDKTDDGVRELRKLYEDKQGQLTSALKLDSNMYKVDLREANFVQFYPYPPHFIELSIYIASGIRLQPGAPRSVGGSNRTIIKQAYEMLVSPRTNMKDKQIGRLVTLDLIYELVEPNLSSQRQSDMNSIIERFKGDAEDGGWAARVAKAIMLLEFVRNLARTESNLAAMLVDEVGKPAPLPEVKAALARLEHAGFIKNSDEGYKLLTVNDRNWEDEKRGYVPKPKDRVEIVRDVLTEIFEEPRLKTYRYKDMKNFRVGITVNGARVGEEGQLTLLLLAAEDEADFVSKRDSAQQDSRFPAHQNDIYWAFSLNQEIDDLVASLFASRSMVSKYNQMRAQNKITNEEASALASEKAEEDRTTRRLREKVAEALSHGQGIFRGVIRDASDLGKTLPEIVKRQFDNAIPDLYQKLEMGYRPLDRNAAEDVLKAANLNALPQVMYDIEGGLALVVKEGARYVANANAAIAKEVLGYLNREHSYGTKVTGKSLEDHFGGIGYGWEREMLQLVLAVLLRAGSIEVTHQGQRFRDHSDPQCRMPLTNNVAFRSASFAPRTGITLPVLTKAVQQYEELTGEEVDVDASSIGTAFRKFAQDELNQLVPLGAEIRANKLPLTASIDEYSDTLKQVLSSDNDDAVHKLAGEGTNLRETRDEVRKIRDVVTPENLEVIQQARVAVEQLAPSLASAGDISCQDTVAELNTMLTSRNFYEQMPSIGQMVKAVQKSFRERYLALHSQRTEQYTEAMDEVRGRAEWSTLSEELRASVLAPLQARADHAADLATGATACATCRATLGQLESDLDALWSVRSKVLARIEELTAPEPEGPEPVTVMRVRLSTFFDGALDSAGAVDSAVTRLREHLHKLVAEGVRVVVE
ncbi:MAG: BREX system P-loop protein BrxC [Chloroflexota bacterium]